MLEEIALRFRATISLIADQPVQQDVITAAVRWALLEASNHSGLSTHELAKRTGISPRAMRTRLARLIGIGRIKAQQLVAIMEIGQRAMSTSNGEQPILNRAELIASYLSPVAVGLDIEKFWVLWRPRQTELTGPALP